MEKSGRFWKACILSLMVVALGVVPAVSAQAGGTLVLFGIDYVVYNEEGRAYSILSDASRNYEIGRTSLEDIGNPLPLKPVDEYTSYVDGTIVTSPDGTEHKMLMDSNLKSNGFTAAVDCVDDIEEQSWSHSGGYFKMEVDSSMVGGTFRIKSLASLSGYELDSVNPAPTELSVTLTQALYDWLVEKEDQAGTYGIGIQVAVHKAGTTSNFKGGMGTVRSDGVVRLGTYNGGSVILPSSKVTAAYSTSADGAYTTIPSAYIKPLGAENRQLDLKAAGVPFGTQTIYFKAYVGNYTIGPVMLPATSETSSGTSKPAPGTQVDTGTNLTPSAGATITATPGTQVTDAASNAVFKVRADGTSVEYVKPAVKAASVVIPKQVVVEGVTCKVTSIGANAFAKDKKVKKVKLSNNVKVIGKSAFNGCVNLTNVTLGNGLTEIGQKAFYGCKKLKKITIPAKVAKIGSQAFRKCGKLANVTFKTSTLTAKSVGSKAFGNTAAKVTVTVPKKAYKAYKKWIAKKGFKKNVKIKKK